KKEEKGDFNWADVKDFSNKENEKKSKFNEFILFIGRIEQRKNIIGMIELFEILKKKYNYKGRLLLAGKYGHGSDQIRKRIARSDFQKEIVCLGYIRDEQKWELLHSASVFLFPSLCEGFGIPILEAQSCGLPVITSNYGPMNEVVKDDNILVDPLDFEAMAKKVNKILTDKNFREEIIEKGKENIKRFSWEKSGEEVARVLVKE
ncbi:MAG: glycosyltransferase family 1 protein, partial [Patescibacteria group bacterium]|nr:glycosyltransferase family 1 protein [Patescibacteria group bacterium]